MSKKQQPIHKTFLGEIKEIIDASRRNAVRSVDFCRVQMYWHLGKLSSKKNSRERTEPTMALI